MGRVRMGRNKNVSITIGAVLVLLAVVIMFTLLLSGRAIPVLETHGTIAGQERNLIITVVLLASVVVVPVLGMLFGIAWRYRVGNNRALYQPNMGGSRRLESLWWGIPLVIILILSVITYTATHSLDPYKPLPLAKGQAPVKIQVVALQWRWLFIYPGTEMASVNDLTLPVRTPVELSITADAPMNSFWVPALAGQVYAMPGMSTKLNLSADDIGTYNGVSSNISGSGFSQMSFKVHAVNMTDYKSWLAKGTRSPNMLTYQDYQALAKPSTDSTSKSYMLMDNSLYNEIINSYTANKNGQNAPMEMSN